MRNFLRRLDPSHPIDKCFHAAFSSDCKEKERKTHTLICLHPEIHFPSQPIAWSLMKSALRQGLAGTYLTTTTKMENLF